MPGRTAAALRAGQDLVEDARRRLDLNVTEELVLQALALRLAERLAS
jgi:hypothetical protein